ncbi:hypothetical protein EV359DRAFT_88318 [Lentinula novae-zelandiae]|nr:hypothetical protein EV359DRAFT_88318 [Lentinula novae-zelandiae]
MSTAQPKFSPLSTKPSVVADKSQENQQLLQVAQSSICHSCHIKQSNVKVEQFWKNFTKEANKQAKSQHLKSPSLLSYHVQLPFFQLFVAVVIAIVITVN